MELVTENITALGYDALYSGRISPIFRRNLLTPGQPFQTIIFPIVRLAVLMTPYFLTIIWRR